MALINCSMASRTVVVTSGQNDVTSVTLEIIPDSGYVVAARDFTAGTNPDATKIQSITLSDSETTGGPQNDGSYTASNKVNVVVDFVDSYAPTENITLDIDPSGSATPDNLIPVKLQGTFVVPGTPDKVTFVASSVEDFASSASATDFYAYDNPGDLVTIMVMTIAATTNDFIDEDPTVVITNSGNANASDDYTISRVDTLDSSDRLTQVVYTIKATIPDVDRSGDVITFTGAGEDIPGLDKKIYGYRMNTGDAGLNGINRRLEIFGDEYAQFRIKMQRGTLDTSDPPVFTIDSTYGIYVFDNSQITISDIFEASTSTTTYPSEIQSDGSYDAATDPHTLDNTGIFFKNILIPEDAADKVYRFTIIPETGTTIDANAPGIDVVPDPDVITFDITRKGFAFFTSTYDGRSSTTNTTEYFDHEGVTKGSVEPRGRKNSIPNKPADEYDYEIVITHASDFHLPNQANEFTLTDLNYTKTLNSGSITDPKIVASVRSNADGYNIAEIPSGGYDSHTHAENHEPNTTVALTEVQREALTNKAGFSLASISDDITIVGDSQFFKIKFFTTDETPVYKSQTIEVSSEFFVSGGIATDGTVNQQNTTTVSAPAIDRTKLYLKGENMLIDKWGTDDITLTHNLSTFAFTSAPTATTLNLSFNISEVVKKFVNSISRGAGYTSDIGYSSSMEVSDNGGAYSKQNITTTTSSVKITITGAFLVAEDGLPSGYTTGDYELLFLPRLNDSTFANTTLTVDSAPTLTLTDSSNVNRKLALSSFSVVIDFASDLSGLSASNSYVYNADIIHRFNNTYEDISDIEDTIGGTGGSPGLASY